MRVPPISGVRVPLVHDVVESLAIVIDAVHLQVFKRLPEGPVVLLVQLSELDFQPVVQVHVHTNVGVFQHGEQLLLVGLEVRDGIVVQHRVGLAEPAQVPDVAKGKNHGTDVARCERGSDQRGAGSSGSGARHW